MMESWGWRGRLARCWACMGCGRRRCEGGVIEEMCSRRIIKQIGMMGESNLTWVERQASKGSLAQCDSMRCVYCCAINSGRVTPLGGRPQMPLQSTIQNLHTPCCGGDLCVALLHECVRYPCSPSHRASTGRNLHALPGALPTPAMLVGNSVLHFCWSHDTVLLCLDLCCSSLCSVPGRLSPADDVSCLSSGSSTPGLLSGSPLFAFLLKSRSTHRSYTAQRCRRRRQDGLKG